MSRMVRICAAALIALSLIGSGAASAADRKVTIGWTAWSDAEAITRIAKQILEKKMNYQVELLLLDIALQYSGLQRGDIDVMLMAWLPNTHADYWERVKEDVDDLGVLYEGASLGWVVPNHVPKEQLRTIADLKKPDVRDRLDGRIQGIDPGAGLMRLSKKAIDAYGLENYELIASSGAGMTAALKRAIARKEWVVVTGWRPHWMFGAFDLRYLEDPRGALGGKESIHAIAREGYARAQPEVAAFISRMRIPLDELEKVMYAAEQSSYEEAAKDYIASHEKLVSYWISGRK